MFSFARLKFIIFPATGHTKFQETNRNSRSEIFRIKCFRNIQKIPRKLSVLELRFEKLYGVVCNTSLKRVLPQMSADLHVRSSEMFCKTIT